MIGLENCRSYNSLRDEYSFDELPDKEQQHWNRSGVVKSIESFMYCSSCNEFSAIIEIDEY